MLLVKGTVQSLDPWQIPDQAENRICVVVHAAAAGGVAAVVFEISEYHPVSGRSVPVLQLAKIVLLSPPLKGVVMIATSHGRSAEKVPPVHIGPNEMPVPPPVGKNLTA